VVEIDVSYEGELRCRAVHVPTQTELSTDAPRDNHGKGETFSATDLCATALGTCMLTIMGIRARERGWNIEGSTARVSKLMTNTGPRRIRQLRVRLTVKGAGALSTSERRVLEHAAHTCPVRLSLADAIDVPVDVIWE